MGQYGTYMVYRLRGDFGDDPELWEYVGLVEAADANMARRRARINGIVEVGDWIFAVRETYGKRKRVRTLARMPAQSKAKWQTCPVCEGRGQMGGGYYLDLDESDSGRVVTCRTCDGSGKLLLPNQ